MTISADCGFAVNEDLRGFNLMNLPLEILHHVLSFLFMEDIVNFAFVSRQAFNLSRTLAWEELDFSDGHYWLKDMVFLGDRAQVTCRSLTLPDCFKYGGRINEYKYISYKYNKI
jgi:hypothetical protein